MLRTVEAEVHLEGSREEFFDIVCDYDRYAAWVPSFENCSVLNREGDITIVEVQASRWKTGSFTLEIVHCSSSTIEFHRIDSLDSRALTGRLELSDDEAGADNASVLVRAKLRAATPILSLGVRRRMREELRATLDALGDRRRYLTSARSSTAPARQKILEIVPEARGLKVWYMGETFLLPRLRE